VRSRYFGSLPAVPTVCADTTVMPSDSTASRTFSTVVPVCTGTTNWLPPANSTPTWKPLKTMLLSSASTISPDAMYHRFRDPMKLMLVSPR
jgi:hypothetical protein